MSRSQGFIHITVADFIVRSAYQMGKTPLLPIFALTLGASDVYLGFIVSVSTLTGMMLKPVFGVLSDRWGRRTWLLVGTVFFVAMPFSYRLVQTPGQLLVVRLIHGCATAIYGPVTLAYVAEQSPGRVAEQLGVFGMARSAGYVVGPAAAGWLLLTMSPVAVFTLIGVLSSLSILPLLFLREANPPRKNRHTPLAQQVLSALNGGSRTPSVWLAGSLEATMYIALYGVRAYLPIYALSMGVSTVLAGGFFAIQEATHMLVKPFCGRLGDRWGHLPAVSGGMAVLGAALALVTFATGGLMLILPSILMGISQALITPSTIALVSKQVDADKVGAGMGLVGTLKNAGKVAGPVLAGVLIHCLDFAAAFHLIGAVMVLGAVLVWYRPSLFYPKYSFQRKVRKECKNHGRHPTTL